MGIEELYREMKLKLQYMYEHNKDTVTLDQMEFFQLFQILCDMMQIKHITDSL